MLCAWSSQYPHRPIPPDQSRSVGELAHTQSGFSDESQETRLEEIIEISSKPTSGEIATSPMRGLCECIAERMLCFQWSSERNATSQSGIRDYLGL